MKLAFLLLAAAATLFPQQNPSVRAHGDASVTAAPDQVSVQIGVITQAQTAQAATAANSKQATDVIAEMKKIAGAGAEIRTVNYSVSPNYRYPKDGGTPTINGYSASNIVQVTTPDTSAVGKIIDAATRTGANTIHGINFSLRDQQKARTEALREATRQARASAEAMASALGLKVVRVLRIDDSAETEIPPRPEFMERRAMAAEAVTMTPVEAGTIRVRAAVSVTVEVGP